MGTSLLRSLPPTFLMDGHAEDGPSYLPIDADTAWANYLRHLDTEQFMAELRRAMVTIAFYSSRSEDLDRMEEYERFHDEMEVFDMRVLMEQISEALRED